MLSNERASEHDADQPMVYQVRIKGHLGQRWRDWFEGLTITLEEDGNTLLNGPVLDQSALHGILKKIRDLGMPLLSVNSVGFAPQDLSNVKFSDVKNQQAGDS
jgi:hypothetical protein